MMSRFRISATLPRRLEELGVSPDAVLRQARLPLALFSQGKIWLSTEEMFAFSAQYSKLAAILE
jgi:hypothetical protein